MMKKRAAAIMTKTKLSNGLTLIYLHTKNDPVSACHLLIPRGVKSEPADKHGLTALMCALFLKGTQKRSARELAEEMESIGASLGASAGHDYLEVSCHSIAEYFLKALDMMMEALRQPSYAPIEVEKEKKALIAAIRSKKEHIFTVANETLGRLLFGDHPYGRPTSGKEATVASLTPADLFGWHKNVVVPDGAVLTIASHLPYKTIDAALKGHFGSSAWLKSREEIKPSVPLPKKLSESKQAMLHEPFQQAYLMMAFPATAVDAKDYIPLKVLNAALGGSMSARLFMSLREKKALAYEIGSFFPSRKQTSSLVIYMGLQSSRLEEAKAGIREELQKLQKEKMSAQELMQVKNYLKGIYILDHQTNSQRAHYLGWWEIIGRNAAFDRGYMKEIDRVSRQDVQRAAQKYLGHFSVTVQVRPKKKVAKPAADETQEPLSSGV